MKQIERDHFIEYHPETEDEVRELRERYPNVQWPFQYVCVAKPPDLESFAGLDDGFNADGRHEAPIIAESNPGLPPDPRAATQNRGAEHE
jgi:hypothetical protein